MENLTAKETSQPSRTYPAIHYRNELPFRVLFALFGAMACKNARRQTGTQAETETDRETDTNPEKDTETDRQRERER